MDSRTGGGGRERTWALLAVALSCLPILGVFTRSRIFFVRDLSLTFHSRFLFLRHSVFSGSFPLWDPYVANGQAAVNDPLYQLFHLPSLAVRLLLPELVAYNVWVALPVPLCALGMYLFLRRHVTAPAAAFGAVVFAASGPIVSTTNFPNLSWSVAAVPYVFVALDRLFERRSPGSTGLFAVAVACQALAGEPVTLAGTLAIVAAYVTLLDRRWRDAGLVARAAGGAVAGLLLAAIQYVPLVAASRVSMRGSMTPSDFWAVHPLALLELCMPHFFGDYFNSNLREVAWMLALNSQRDPFYYTMYVGVPIALLAALAALSGRPRTRFWTAVVIVCAIASLGPYTPLYPALQALVPPLKTFRFPVKYLSLGAFAAATLVAMALQWLIEDDPAVLPRRALRRVLVAASVAAALTYIAIAWVLIAPRLPVLGAFRLAIWAKVPAPVQGAEFLLFRARPLLTSLLLKLTCAAFLLWVAASARRERRLALGVLCAFALVDLLASNASVNPTMEARLLADPAWLSHVPRDSHERVYVGGRLEGYVDVFDIDAPKYAAFIEGYSQMEQRFLLTTELLYNPSGSRVREGLSFDLPLLWPLEYAQTVGDFKVASRAERLRYLARVGTRFVLLPTPPAPGAKPLAALVSAEQLKLYDFHPQARRTYIVADALRGPDVTWQIEGMFQPETRFNAARGVLVSEAPPPPAGMAGQPVPPSATFLEDGLNRVVIRAGLPGDGYLALMDTYTSDWKVDVDGVPAPLMRADGLFRAVHLTSGGHLVTFTFRPRAFYEGAAMTGLTAAGLAVWAAWGARRRDGTGGAIGA
jgi:hypothetical protein